jgi:uncharacterized protein YheU (UPF0270 family)
VTDQRHRAPVEVPASELTSEALRGVIEAYVLREGTDYGHTERRLEDKVAAVRRQLERGEAAIYFDPDSGSVTILPAHSTFSAPRAEN